MVLAVGQQKILLIKFNFLKGKIGSPAYIKKPSEEFRL
jgi:hypothetical protein